MADSRKLTTDEVNALMEGLSKGDVAGDQGVGKIFGSIQVGLLAFENKAVGLHAIVDVRDIGKWMYTAGTRYEALKQ